jgi:hypothetical protein
VRAKRTDKAHAAVLDAIRSLGYPAMSLHAHGGGLEDILVGITCVTGVKCWILIEVKSPRNKRGEATESQFTPAQKEWYSKTEGFPRIIVANAQDCVDLLRSISS